ncbi:hypothetical protein KP509_08G047000 [Ceratopteris richardii]|uniref:RING-type E3 ubiquitin transferase n=1 Tax=Ceratopteris richardii TaxID=49495 RepID=A0A8T2UDQ0_CERRI|nr:hypothetical protein KP509_08G047000 [Ceratopteris richardii]
MEPRWEQEIFVVAEKEIFGGRCCRLALLLQEILNLFREFEELTSKKSGLQALCEVHWGLDRAKSFLHRVANSSILYLAITCDSVASKFMRIKEFLIQSLRNLEPNIPDKFAQQVSRFINELQGISFESNASDKDAGKELLLLLQKEKEDPDFSVDVELEVFGLNYCKFCKPELSEETCAAELACSCPASPSEMGSQTSTSEQDSDFSSELCFLEFHPRGAAIGTKDSVSGSCHPLTPPQEFVCPISLQIMSDPVIISSGQTYERVCIEKWFEEGHDTCPKTQQKLTHLVVTPNYCVKGLITSWCERYSFPLPRAPSPMPSPITSSVVAFSECVTEKAYLPHSDSTPLSSCEVATIGSPRFVPDGVIKRLGMQNGFPVSHRTSGSVMNTLNDYAKVLCRSPKPSFRCEQLKAVEDIRRLCRDNSDTRIYIGDAGLIPALVHFLNVAFRFDDDDAMEISCLALLNVAINNCRNKAEIVNVGAVSLLLKILGSEAPLSVREAAIAVFLTVSCLDENKPTLGSSGVIPHLISHLDSGTARGVKDALTTLFNLSIFPGNHACLLKEGMIQKINKLLTLGDLELTEKCITILHNLMLLEETHRVIAETDGCLSVLADVFDTGTPKEKDLIVGIFLTLSKAGADYTRLMLNEGVIPSLVMLSVNGTMRGREKAQKLLQHFREQRQKDTVLHDVVEVLCSSKSSKAEDLLGKSAKALLRKKTGTGLSLAIFRKSKSFSFPRC